MGTRRHPSGRRYAHSAHARLGGGSLRRATDPYAPSQPTRCSPWLMWRVHVPPVSTRCSSTAIWRAERARQPGGGPAPPRLLDAGLGDCPRIALARTGSGGIVTDSAPMVGIIGGSGLYSLFPGAAQVDVGTPYGDPSSSVTVAEVEGHRVAFLARHGLDHRIPPHRINYRANLWALHSLGVERVLAPAAVGGLAPGLGPGSLVVPDQLVDWTRGRGQTFHDAFDDVPVHASFADPYCPDLRAVALAAARAQGWEAADGGAMVVIDGPRFSTRAESVFFQAQGWSVVNMTGHPEAVLARELGMCYATLALVTDVDAGAATGEGVTVAEVMAEFARNTDRLRTVLFDAAVRAAQDRDCRH